MYPIFLSKGGLRAIVVAEDGNSLFVIDMLTGKELFNLSSFDLRDIVGDGSIYFGDGSSSQFSSQEVNEWFFDPPRSLPVMIDLALSSLSSERRDKIESIRRENFEE